LYNGKVPWMLKQQFTLKKKKTFTDNLLTHMSSKMSTSFFLEVFDENIPGFSPYNGLHWEPNGSRSK